MIDGPSAGSPGTGRPQRDKWDVGVRGILRIGAGFCYATIAPLRCHSWGRS